MNNNHVNFTSDRSLITAIIPKGSVNSIFKEIQQAGASTCTVALARGSMKLEKLNIFKPTISPEQEILKFVVVKELEGSVMAAVVKAANLELSGSGAVYASPVIKASYHKDDPSLAITEVSRSGDSEEPNYQRDLIAISCILQKGKADDVAVTAMDEGAPGPTIFFGLGRGVRERLGILRIAVSPEKELLEVVVGKYDADNIFESMVESGRLDTPGMGFIYIKAVPRGIVNISSTIASGKSLASLSQIIKALDDVKGSTAWRSQGSTMTLQDTKRKYLTNLIDLTCVAERGRGDILTQAALKAGAPGASITYAYEKGGVEEIGASGRAVSTEKELIQMIIPPDKVDPIVTAMIEAGALQEPGKDYFYAVEVSKALTYLGPDTK